MEYRRSEIGAGIFILVAFLILVVMIFAVSDVESLFKKKKEVMVLFQFSDGIEKNAQVRYSGIKIGKVTNIRVSPEHGDKIELTLSVYSDAVIKYDTKAAIKTLGLVGGKYVELTGGTPQGKPLAPGELLIGEESFKIEDLTKSGLEVVEKLKHIATNIDRILGDQSTVQAVKVIVQNLQDTSGNLKDMSANVKVMTSNKDEIAQGMKNVPEALNKLPQILKKLDDVTANLKSLSEHADGIMVDNRKQIDDTLENVRQITQNLKETTDDLKKHPWKLIRKP